MNARIEAIAAEFTDDSAVAQLTISHSGPLWRWKSIKSDAPAAWFFVTIDGEAGETIADAPVARGGFGSFKVEARIGKTGWKTSVFTLKKPAEFVLPVKAAVRKAEGLGEGDVVRVALTLT